MKVYGNQKVVKVNKPSQHNKELYTHCSQAAMFQAMRDLNHTKAGFALWMYMVKNEDKHQFALSSADFTNVSGYTRKAYDAAVEALINNGYLVLVSGTKNQYIFYEKKLVLLENNEDKKNSDTSGNITCPLTAQLTCPLGDNSLPANSTTNNKENKLNNKNNILAEKTEDDNMKKTITLKELKEQEALGREFQVHSNEGYVEFFDNDEVMFIAPDVAAYYY